MNHNILMFMLLILALMLSGCGSADSENQSGEVSDTSFEIQEASVPQTEESSDTEPEIEEDSE